MLRKIIPYTMCLIFHTGMAQDIKLQDGWKFKTGDDAQWSDPSLNDSDWKNISPEKRWEDQGITDYDGYAWYRLKFKIPSSLKETSFLKDTVEFILGKIDDNDQTFLNGKKIGQNGGASGEFERRGTSSRLRRYHIAANDPAIHWNGENVIAIRVHDFGGGGGLYEGPFLASMVDVLDMLRLDTWESPFEFYEDKTLSKKINLHNLSANFVFDGLLNVQVTQKGSDKPILEKKINAKIIPGQTYTYEFKLPQVERTSIHYTFYDSKSKSTLTQVEEVPYILTPVPSSKPRINGAKVFGARPGSPILYSIAASGERPMTFTINNLPLGLSLDKQTGMISGKVKDSGDYVVNVTTENKHGKASRSLRIAIGDKIALTPPMGWNSWNCWGLSVSDEKVREAAANMKSSGLIHHGWTYINIDDGWEDTHKDGVIVTNSKFPDMKNLADYVHNMGLKIGIYSSPGTKTCGGYEGSYQYEESDAAMYAAWGIDYLKYDWCSYRQLFPNPTLDELKRPYLVMRDALLKTNRDIVYSLCQYGLGKVWEWGAEVGGNTWRTTGDIRDTWNSMSGIGFRQDVSSAFAGPGHWNDPDMLVVGKVGWGPSLHPTKLTPSEQYTHISLWALLSSPLLLGCDLSKIDPFTMSLLTNDEVLEINQDPLGKQAVKQIKNEKYEVWMKPLEDGSIAVGVFNLSLIDEKIKIVWSDLGVTGQRVVHDVWRQKDIGKSDVNFETEVPSHGVMLMRVSPSNMK